MPPTFNMGRIEIAITIMPIPPSHWRSARHINIPGDCVLKFVMTVDPVVVNPDMASNKASLKLSSAEENWNGKDEKSANAIQEVVVIIKA